MAKNSYAVFGLGSFGSKLAVALADAGHNVMVCDINAQRINEMRDKVAEAIIADVSSEEVIKELNVRKFDAVILGMSSRFENQVLALSLLKQEGAKRVIVKSTSSVQERILLRLGADEVIQPEQDVADRLARRLTLSNIAEIIDFKGAAVADVAVPEALTGKPLRLLDLRNRHHVTILLVRKFGENEAYPVGPDTVFDKDDQLTVFGSRQAIIKLFKER